ncbi:MAG TPA: lysylphosphatidylglycerol synthase transmembrane domain-containing protein [Gemmatimonadales bacterium]|nr:lysylphosphatidylglycerol synthase transmembrane domain-containing protein [Gemmatimonadales bacterium]
MRLDPLTAHLICIGLVTADIVARSLRLKFFCDSIGSPLSLGEGIVVNAFGDAACSLTPARLGGEPARLAGILRYRIPTEAAIVAITVEALLGWPMIIAGGAFLTWRYAPEWWQTAEPGIVRHMHGMWPWFAVVGVVSILLWWLARRWIRVSAPDRLRRSWQRVRVYWRRMPHWPIVLSQPLSFVNVAARTAILPVLALTLPSPPPMGPLFLGSFALLYSQMILPTPSGAGVVELGFLAGAAGSLGGEGAELLVWWRFYTSVVGVVLGLGLAARIYGWAAFRAWFRHRAPAAPE